MLVGEIPLLPDPDDARRLLESELSDPAYAEARPTLLDRMAKAVFDFIADIFNGSANGGGSALIVIIVAAVVITLAVLAVVFWGRPRLRAASRVDPDDLFGSDEGRPAAELRAAAATAARDGRFDDAIVLEFRALARGLAERGAVSLTPGATVHAFASEATTAFPTAATELGAVADVFDAVRYLRAPGTQEAYQRVCALDATLTRTRPAALAPLPGGVS
ncbi:DUF4129 domain-containing protein [Microbacterium gorillae]|uniref:DUF4129 domain-containing protein n=1 Tax=Microbacterium gorillae TaxID=1231063 RepID=UPI00069341BE|nr:DUF4129 domain-containing protein [Microbacterium gorillae]